MIGSDGQRIGIQTLMRFAWRVRKDSTWSKISPKLLPPVCKIMDYGRFKYETTRRNAKNAQKPTVIEVKK